MKEVWLVGACVVAVVAAAYAQPITRIKAKLTAFDGKVMTLQTDAKEPVLVSVTPETRFVQSQATDLGSLKEGAYTGAAVSEGAAGRLRAENVYLYADALRGTGEGRFPERDRVMVNGTVSKIEPGGTPDSRVLTLHYRGAVLTKPGRGRTICEGRANPEIFASPLACSADAVIAVGAGTPVSSLTLGDAGLLAPGATVTVSMVKLADGGAIAPGVIVEKPAAPTVTTGVAKSPPTP